MIDVDIQGRIIRETEAFWHEHTGTQQFLQLTRGKEIGHRIADYVDDHTAANLKVNADITVENERNSQGKVIKRSMGDIWVQSGGMYNPVNIKAGVTVDGSPNVVSLAKLIDRLLKRQIDSYYLLIIKTPLPLEDGGMIEPKVFLIDLLDCLEFVNFDAGPGQVMLREKELYAALVSGWRPSVSSLDQKLQQCMEVMEDGYARLLRNREQKLSSYRQRFTDFKPGAVNQDGLYFG